MKRYHWTLLMSALLSMSAHADNGALTSELKVWTVVKQADGAEALQPARAVKPGDLLQYATVYTNPGKQAVTHLVTQLPIPAGTEWVGASAVPSVVLATLDGKVYAPVPLLRKTRRADGQMVEVPVPLAEYRALRWPEQQLAAGATFTTIARVRVVNGAAPIQTPSEPPSAAATAVPPAPKAR